MVDLVRKTCNCKVWDLTGIPYMHGVAAIFVNCEKSEYYTHPCYYKDAYVEAYKTLIPFMLGQSKWTSSGQNCSCCTYYLQAIRQATHKREEGC